MHEALMPAPDVIPWPAEPVSEFMEFMRGREPFTVPDVLFKKIEDAQVQVWKQRFGGT
jgi:methionyl-tRNA synthetase